MNVDPQLLLDAGFIIVREVVPAGELEKLQVAFETLVDRQREVWAEERGPDDPPGGVWETSAQPRLVHFEQFIDAQTALSVEFCLGETTLGVSRQIMGALWSAGGSPGQWPRVPAVEYSALRRRCLMGRARQSLPSQHR
jgi:hypothetical protein